MDSITKINDILVNLFNLVLKLEEKSIQDSTRHDLSITELHTLAAIGASRPKMMSQVAAALQISVSTLTAAVNKLVQKGYIERFRTPEDRRIVKIQLTNEGVSSVEEHEAFHRKMIGDAIESIPEEQVTRFIDSIDSINQYLLTLKHPPIKVEGEFELKPLTIGKVNVPVPIFQGALSIGLSGSRLAAAVSKEGGAGVIAATDIGFDEPDFCGDPQAANVRVLKWELKKAFELVRDCKNRGPIGVNVMWSAKYCRTYVEAAVAAGAEFIVCGAGVPTTLPSYCKNKDIPLIPIVASKRAAMVIIRNWAKKYNRTPDGFIFQGPFAGGYLGVKEAKVEAAAEDFYKNIADLKGELEQMGDYPLIVCGGIYTKEDAKKVYAYGADGYQMGTRFVTTEECDAPDAFKQVYLNCTGKDVTMITSPEGFPGRVVKSKYAERLQENPGCGIRDGLLSAARGDLENGLVFCGSKIDKADKIERVSEIFKEFIT